MNIDFLQEANKTVDCQGLSCPMPIVKTKRAITEIHPGQVLEVLATDPGSVADVQSWSRRTGHEYLGTVEDGPTFKHYIRRAALEQTEPDKKHPLTASHETLLAAMEQDVQLLDVREPLEYAAGHIPSAVSVPLGQIKNWITEHQHLAQQKIFVVCHSGNRSDTACKILHEHGFHRVFNVVEGMRKWTGPIHVPNGSHSGPASHSKES